MKEFLANIRPPKFLRYLFYIAYSGYRRYKSDREDAHVMATILLATFNGLVIFMLFSYKYGDVIDSIKNDYFVILPYCLFLGMFFYYLFYIEENGDSI